MGCNDIYFFIWSLKIQCDLPLWILCTGSRKIYEMIMTVEDWVNYRQYYKIYLNDKDIPSINLLMVIFTTNGKNDLSDITVSCTK